MGPKLRTIRESRGITRKQLAESTGLTTQAITQVEMGRRQPAFRTLVCIARGLDISLDSLVGLTGSTPMTDVTRNADVMAMAEKIARMSKDLQDEVKGFVDFVWDKKARKRAHKS